MYSAWSMLAVFLLVAVATFTEAGNVFKFSQKATAQKNAPFLNYAKEAKSEPPVKSKSSASTCGYQVSDEY